MWRGEATYRCAVALVAHAIESCERVVTREALAVKLMIGLSRPVLWLKQVFRQ